MKTAAIGHVEWMEFVRVEHVPRVGQIVHGDARWEEPGGGGAVAAVQLARLAGECDFFTALGDDEAGHRSLARLRQLGVTVHVAWRSRPTRRGVTLVDPAGERTIVTIGERLEPRGSDALPWGTLAAAQAVYFTAGDAAALHAARAARVLVASPRARSALDADVPLDALILSARDADERREAERLSGAPIDRRPQLVVLTEGALGGLYRARDGTRGRWHATELPGPIADSYGCGDSFAAAVAFGLALGHGRDAALELGARAGAMCLTGHGPYGRQLADGDC